MRTSLPLGALLAAGLASAASGCALPDEAPDDVATAEAIPHEDWRAFTMTDGALFLLGPEVEDSPFREVLAWDLERSAPRWMTRVRGSEDAGCASVKMFDAEDVLVLALPGAIVALDTADGRERWHAPESAWVNAVGPANGAFYAIVDGERFVALDLRDGHEIASLAPEAAGRTSWMVDVDIAPGGRFAEIERADDDEDPIDLRVPLFPQLGRPVRVPMIPYNAEYAGHVPFGEPVGTRIKADVQLRLRGDVGAPKLEGWSIATRLRRWSLDLSAEGKRVLREEEPWSPRVVLSDEGPWFLALEGKRTYELRRAEDGGAVCLISLDDDDGAAMMHGLPGFVLVSTNGWLRLYDARDCSVRWSGHGLEWVDAYSVDFDATRLVVVQDPPRRGWPREAWDDWLRVIDLRDDLSR